MDMRLGLGVAILLVVLVVLARVSSYLRGRRRPAKSDPAERWLTSEGSRSSGPDAPVTDSTDGDGDGDL